MFKSPFTASREQVATYLFGVALFSISFLVFLNASVSFVITDLIGQKKRVGDAVGTLGFADELVALVACPCWGMLSDRLGTRNVVFLGYMIVGLALFIFVQASNVYPQLLLARLLFSIGGAATATMVTAILPTMTTKKSPKKGETSPVQVNSNPGSHNFSTSISSEATITPARFSSPAAHNQPNHPMQSSSKSATSQIAGLVGMFTGLGALIALGAFLPLPALFQRKGFTPAHAVAFSYYIVGSVAIAMALFCYFGLRNLAGEESKGWRTLSGKASRLAERASHPSRQPKATPQPLLFFEATRLGFTDVSIGLGYLGGFVARASSVGISLFIPLYVNKYFIRQGLCKDDPFSNPADVKEQCRRAYTLAAALSGVSQIVALVGAPIFGSLDGRFRRFNFPLLTAALCGVVGYICLGQLKSPDPKSEEGGPGVFVIMALLGISQIGAIVCSLSLLGRGIDGGGDESNDAPHDPVSTTEEDDGTTHSDESAYLLPTHLQSLKSSPPSRRHLKGSIAGLYSLTGGAGILLLTKLGGYLFDSLSPGAPFYMLAIFNGILLVVGLVCGIGVEIKKNREQMSL